MARFLLLADTHFHEYPGLANATGGSAQFSAIMEAVLRAVLAAKVDAIIHLGDLFHNRPSLTTTCLHRVTALLRNISLGKDHKVSVVVGNHDMSPSGDGASSVGALQGVIDAQTEVSVTDIAGVRWGFVPYMRKPANVRKACAKLRRLGATVMAGHLGLGDPKYSDCVPADYETQGRISVSDLSGDFQRVFLGHYHNPQEVTPQVIYVGSPIQLSFKEAGQRRGFWTWDSDTDVAEFHEDENAPRYLQVKPGGKPLQYRPGDHLWYRGVSLEEAEVIREQHRDGGVALRIDVTREAKTSTRLPPGLSGEGLLRAYVDSVIPSADPVEKTELVATGKEIADAAKQPIRP